MFVYINALKFEDIKFVQVIQVLLRHFTYENVFSLVSSNAFS